MVWAHCMPCPDDSAAGRAIVRRQKIQLIDDLRTEWSGDRRLLDIAILQVDSHDGTFPWVNRKSDHFGSSFAWGAHANLSACRAAKVFLPGSRAKSGAMAVTSDTTEVVTPPAASIWRSAASSVRADIPPQASTGTCTR